MTGPQNQTLAGGQVGAKGVQLKHFEQVCAALLKKVQPSYVQLPPRPRDVDNARADWPFDQLPAAARVFGELKGQLSNPERAKRKEDQLRSILRCIFALLPSNTDNIMHDGGTYTIVDFGGGSGHLATPLALLLPFCRVIVVDLSEKRLDLLHEKAAELASTTRQNGPFRVSHESTAGTRLLSCEGIPNLFTFHGPACAFQDRFDMCVALHLCGEATDVALRLAGRVQAQAIVVAPCCVGKLSRNSKNPYVYQATGRNTPTVQYPQSEDFCQWIGQNELDWNSLAKAADYGEMAESRTSRNASRRTAKALLETDRRLYLERAFGYQTALTRMAPWEATPKNDILLAWKDTSHELDCYPDPDCQIDIQHTINHLLVSPEAKDKNCESGLTNSKELLDSVYWTWEEEQEVRKTLHDFIDRNISGEVLVFPHMLRRKRKMIHYVAEQMDLAHWSKGRKSSDKTVAVARRRMQRSPS